jgi:thiamine biosynthesis lipoprotein
VDGGASLRFEALGSECELYAIDSAEPLEQTAEWITEMHRRLTRFEPTSELSQFNARAGEWTDVSPELGVLLNAALDAYVMSDGLVHAGVLPALVDAGYDKTFEDLTGPSSRSASHPDPARPLSPLPDLLEVRPSSARLAPGAAIDLGGLAKGWIADKAVERMGPNSLANCGGDLYAHGGGETGEGWPVGFGGKTVLLKDLGAATSGTMKRRWGDGRHHLIDPRTGAPAVTDLTEVSVLAPTALEAEILAKTALILGSALAPRALERRASGWALS